jgi:hypothetical protein
MKNKTNKLAKLERSRYSIFTDDLDTCIECGMYATDMNEIYQGRNRQNSMKWGLCIPMCRKCHTKYTNDRNMQLKWMIKGQKEWYKYFDGTKEEWLEIFKRSYID